MYNNLYRIIGKILAENGETRTLTLLQLTNRIISKHLSVIEEPLVFEYDTHDIDFNYDYNIELIIDGTGLISWGDGNETEFSGSIRNTYKKNGLYRVKLYHKKNIYRVIFDEQTLSCITNFITIGRIGINGLNHMFANSDFNGKIGPNWDTGKVKNMSYMFYNAKKFNQPIGYWDLSNVTDLTNMFNGAESFDRHIGNWDVSKVVDMDRMFHDAVSFNRPLDNWNVSNVSNMSGMFKYAERFNQPLNNWDISKVAHMSRMFMGAVSFNKPLDNWNVSRVTDMTQMLYQATSFNQSINNWKLEELKHMDKILLGAEDFDQKVELDVTNWKITQSMFQDTKLEGRRIKLIVD